MAKIEELVRQISDVKLRDEIATEIKELKKQKRFGLVFEEHLPEMLRLPKAKIRLGNLVAHRDAFELTGVGIPTIFILIQNDENKTKAEAGPDDRRALRCRG